MRLTTKQLAYLESMCTKHKYFDYNNSSDSLFLYRYDVDRNDSTNDFKCIRVNTWKDVLKYLKRNYNE
jgi:hypothetical protein